MHVDISLKRGWGSLKGVYIVYEDPLCIFKEKKIEKVCTKKNCTHISVRGWIRTHGHYKIITLERDALDLSRPQSCVTVAV